MATYTVSALKFVRPQPELIRDLQASTILGPLNKGWTAVVNEDSRVLTVKVRKTVEGKVTTVSVRYPLESIDYYLVTAAKAGDEPADPK